MPKAQFAKPKHGEQISFFKDPCKSAAVNRVARTSMKDMELGLLIGTSCLVKLGDAHDNE